MKSYYIASKLESIEKVQYVRDKLKGTFAYDWSKIGPVYKQGQGVIIDTIAAEVHAVVTSSLLIMLLPGGRGAHAELGAALAHNIPTLIYGEDKFFKIDEHLTGFYYHPAVKLRTNNLGILIEKANELLSYKVSI
jgi:hypothetical protein